MGGSGTVRRDRAVFGSVMMVKLHRDNPEPQYRPFSTETLSLASTEELLLELRRRIIRPRDRRGETRDDWDSLDSRGDWDGLEPRGDRRDEGASR